MSTFKGIMEEFPRIRVDYFRESPGERKALAGFLSHIHSDHLAGIENFKGRFIYCSAATKEFLVRLETSFHRVNFATGILEARVTKYENLMPLLKPIPLETPTEIELEPGKLIQVTLFDANHCTGAVMFLFEGDGKAVLYTGDIRSEPWFVNSLARNPFMIEYIGGLKTLDCIYLDTSNTGPLKFPTKAQGLKELLQKVSKYPPDTIFHFEAWTFGYEEVWMALSKALKSSIHVDKYKLRLYKSLRGDNQDKSKSPGTFTANDAHALAGYKCGNVPQVGCLTDDASVRLHSCEKGMRCHTVVSNSNIVWIKPIITRDRYGTEIGEIGVGGGGGDLNSKSELQLDPEMIENLLELFEEMEEPMKERARKMLAARLSSKRHVIALADMGLEPEEDDIPLSELEAAMARAMSNQNSSLTSNSDIGGHGGGLPRVITFPYSRHSSYEELCDLVRILKPKDVYPCTVEEETWHEGITISNLFGDYCSDTVFRHDSKMRQLLQNRTSLLSQQTHTTDSLVFSSPPAGLEKSPRPKLSGAIRTILKRDHRGRLRLFDLKGNEIDIMGSNMESVANGNEVPGQRCTEFPAIIGTTTFSKSSTFLMEITPPRLISAVSPTSESQDLRRKAIMDTGFGGSAKRTRLDFEGPDSSVVNSEEQSQLVPQTADTVSEITDDENDADTPGSEESDQVAMEHQTDPVQSINSTRMNLFSPDVAYDSDGLPYEIDLADCTFFDLDDMVRRCKLCGHETWGERTGFCTECSDEVSEPPYWEVPDPDTCLRPEIVVGEDTNEFLDEGDRRKIVGDYLDDDSSAYDSQDEADFVDEEYEVNSFIDDDSIASAAEDGDVSDEETDYEDKYTTLRVAHSTLLNDYAQMADEFEDFRRDILGSAYNSDSNGSSPVGEMDDHGALIVDASAPDPVVTELILSQAQEQSQNSEISDGRVWDRSVAFEAANSENRSDWHFMSLVSVNNNHTHEEVEL